MDFRELSSYIPRVNAALHATYLKERRATLPEFRRYVDFLDEFATRGGKRFRALLVLAGYHLATGRKPQPALAAAVALEHFQAWMLIHDDIIDHATERRGGPALHRELAEDLKRRRGLGDPESFGAGMAITLGDLQEPFTVDAMLASSGSPSTRLAVITEFARMARATAYGQVLDIENGSRAIGEVSERMVLLVHRLKSAMYTVVSPLRIGAALGGSTPTMLRDLETVGTDLGVAFQLRDDVLGSGFGGASPGKSANDLVEGKRTLLVIHAWKGAKEADRALLERVVGNPTATAAEVGEAQDVIRRTGSLSYSETRMRALHARGLRALDRSRSVSPSGRALLREVGERLVHRSV